MNRKTPDKLQPLRKKSSQEIKLDQYFAEMQANLTEFNNQMRKDVEELQAELRSIQREVVNVLRTVNQQEEVSSSG